MERTVLFVLMVLGLNNIGESIRPAGDASCPPTWLPSSGGDACHKLWPNSKETWDEARETCQRLDADLLKLSSKAEKDGVISEIVKYPPNLEWWIGLKRHGVDDSKWVWVDGETRNDSTKFIMWGSGEPNNHMKSEDCAEIWDNLLNDKHCDTPLQFICEQPIDIPRFCDMKDGWHDIYPGKNCYKLYNQSKTAQDASSICASNNATLVSIFDDEEQKIFSDFVTELNMSVWINLKAGKVSGKDAWLWSEYQRATNIHYWRDGNPDLKSMQVNQTTCVKMSPSISQFKPYDNWEPVGCEGQNSFICEKKLITCPAAYYKFTISKCLMADLSDSLLPWNEARGYCNLRGTSLLEINSRYEMNQLNKLLFTMVGDDAVRSDLKIWTGLSVKGADRVWDSGLPAEDFITKMLEEGGAINDTIGCVYLQLPDCSRKQGNCDDSKLEFKVGDCNDRLVAVCTVPGDTPVNDVSNNKPRYVCPDQYRVIENTCVRRHYGDVMDWFSARQLCQKDGSNLATVESAAKRNFLKAMAVETTWIGLNDLTQEGNYFWSDETTNYSGTMDEVLITNNYVIADQYSENCIAYVKEGNAGKWTDFPCSFKNSFFCQIWAEWNIALGKNVRQSSTYSDAKGTHAARRAIDGCTKMSHSSGCCTHTRTDETPWWELDLGTVYPVRKVIIYRRYEEGCASCKKRMHNFRLFISNTTDTESDPVFQDPRPEPPSQIILVLPDIHYGRYVRIDVPNGNGALSLCEVEVFSEDLNRPKNDILLTEANSNCYMNAKKWKGKVRHGLSGRLCQEWVLNTPHEHTRHVDSTFPDGSQKEAKNYCRDPDGEGRPWCYTVDPRVRWEYCPIPHCNTILKDQNNENKKVDVPVISKEELNTECGSNDWLEDGTGICYRIQGPYTAMDAQTFCEATGGVLAIPQTPADVHFIVDLVSNISLPPNSLVWLGVSYSTVDKTFRTVDQRKLDLTFMNKQVNTPEMQAKVPHGAACIGLKTIGPGQHVSGEFGFDSCLKRHIFICKKEGKYVKVFTPNAKEIQVWNNPVINLADKTAVRFQFKGKSGARIVMKNTAVKSQITVEIHIGLDANTRSTIVTKYTAENGFPAPINVSMYSAFWLSWATGRLQVGEGDTVGNDVFLTGSITGFAGFDYMSLSVSGADVGYWKFLREGRKTSQRKNLALKKTTLMSTTYSDISPSDRGVDGCLKNSYRSGCCIHTEKEWKPWWEVDLGAVYTIGEIVITKRWTCGDECRSGMNKFYVHINTTRISASPITDDTILYSRHDREALPVITLQTPGAKGRYVLIQLPDRGILQFCELEIYEDVNVLCKRGWVNYDRHTCMYFGTDKVDWDTARSQCKAKDPDSDLAVITSPRQDMFVYETAQSVQPSLEFPKFWFGLKGAMDVGVTWWDGSSSNYSRLSPNAGRQQGAAKQCFMTAYNDPSTGNWTKADCTTAMYYICSKTSVEPLTTTTVLPTTTPTTTVAPTTTPLTTTSRPSTRTATVSSRAPSTTAVAAITTPPSKGSCPKGWTVNPTTSSCIFINRTKGFNFLSSEMECLKMQSRLASITSDDEQTFYFAHLFEHVKNEGKFKGNWAGFWIGGLDVEKEGSWRWHLSDDPWFNGISWAPGQPDNYNKKEDCAMIMTNLARLADLNDAPCSMARDGYMCKKDMGDSGCEDGWFYDARTKTCYLIKQDLRSWLQARADCKRTNGADLASIVTDKEQEFIGAILRVDRQQPQLFWVGAKTDPIDDTWWWSDKSTWWMRVAWDDFDAEPGKGCGGVSSTKSLSDKALLKNENCDVKLPYICKKKAAAPDMTVTRAQPSTAGLSTTNAPTIATQSMLPPNTTEVLADKPCGQGWEKRPNSRYCYKFGVDLQSWLKAEGTCAWAGGSLLSITSNEEQHYIAGRLNGMRELPFHMWIGANDRGIEGKWTWVDDAIFAYFNWKSDEPNNNDKKEDCGSIITAKDLSFGENFGLWNDMDCDSPQGYICKKTAQQLTTTVPTTTESPDGVQYSCPGKGWVDYGPASCYLFVQESVSWKTATTECRINGGDLASISHELEQEFIFSQLPQDMYCFDTWENKTECSGWAKRGECTRNPIWMHTNCHKACNVCMHNCNDRYESSAKCLEWANSGECDINPQWMKINCAASCGICKGAPTRGFWIGLYSAKRSHQYEWSDGRDVAFTNWDYTIKQPEYFAYAAGSCVGMFLQTGTWNDGPCDDTLQGYVCKRPKQRGATTAQSPFRIGCTGDNSYGYESYCYTYVKERKTFDDAQKDCVENGGNLAIIKNRYIQSFISSELINLLQDYWIGIKYVNKEFKWTNYDGPLKFINFAKSFNFSGESDCCFAMTTFKPVGMWKDHACAEKLPSICQFPREGITTPPTTTQTTTEGKPCSPGWKEYKGNCYYFPDEEVDWYSASSSCRRMSANVVSIENEEENRFVVGNILEVSWLGLHDMGVEGTFEWSDGKLASYFNWNDEEPNNAGDEDCVSLLFNGRWNDLPCERERYYVCKIPKGKQVEIVTTTLPSTVITTTQPPELCGAGSTWSYHNGFCYQVFDNMITWQETVAFCNDHGGNLVSIHTAEEQQFISNMVDGLFGVVWLGFNDLDVDGVFRWNDGTPTDYTNWLPGQPNDGGGGEKCVCMNQNDGKWHDYPCSVHKYAMCRRPQGTPSTQVVPTTQRPGGCKPEFREYGNRCFYIGGLDGSGLKDWNEAQRTCQGKQASLTSIHSLAQNAFLTSLFHDAIAKNFWIGLNDIMQKSGAYDWADNSVVDFANWAENEPSSNRHYYNRELCVEMFGTEEKAGLWNDAQCDVEKAYVCSAFKSTDFVTNKTNNCPMDYQPYQDHCYRFLTGGLSWDSSRVACSKDGGYLVSINSVYEKAFVESLWKEGTGPLWVGMKLRKYGEDKWITGEPQTMSGLRTVLLNTTVGCLSLEGNKWRIDKCYQNYIAVCEIPTVLTTQRTTPAEEKICSNRDLFLYNNYCYYVSTEPVPFGSVQAKCQARSMEFVSIHSYRENEELSQMANVTALKSRPAVLQFFIGMSFEKYRDQLPKWVDHTTVNYLHIDPVFYDLIRLNPYEELCFAFDATSKDISTWRPVVCQQPHGYICKMKADAPQTTVTTTTTTSTTSTTTTPPTTTTTTTPSTTTTTVTTTTGTTQAPLKRKAPAHFKQKDEGLSPSQIAAIVVGSLACLLIIILLVYAVRSGYMRKYFYRVQNRQPGGPSIGFDNALFSKGDASQNDSVNFD